MKVLAIMAALVLGALVFFKYGITYTHISARGGASIVTKGDYRDEVIKVLQAYGSEHGYSINGYKLNVSKNILAYSLKDGNGRDLMTVVSHEDCKYELSFYEVDGVYIKNDFMRFMKDNSKFYHEIINDK
ncbi:MULTISPECIES: hypothetical protein [Burkholderia]|uniref:hypothetical protein n=1 Tax=Burkholderia TaxID=32008 RepID=UPI00158D3219|nr:hypothetical protein [Burkholderia cepacia]MCA7936670.1 hypothetical protein [Burkholderia cepacia]MCA8052907.1 hypothetical protein [Burkholderia cepacia]MCA8134091.1 hypothetical protein [Burkholderia cepacia]MCA8158824.1 hypothetical protein [Burkholderia cepacia]MDN7611699.1 hypothetical protein [Burkholderia cepacia]